MAVSELPGNPNAVWTVKKNIEGTFNFKSIHQRPTLIMTDVIKVFTRDRHSLRLVL